MKQHNSKKMSSWLKMFMIGSVFFLIILVIVLTITTENSKHQHFAKSINESTSSLSTLKVTETTYKNISMITETSKDPTKHFILNYPKTPFNNVNKQINQYITDSKENYISELRNTLANTTNCSLNINVNIYPYKENYYSIVFTKTKTMNPIEKNVEITTYFINNSNGKIISARNLLNNDVGHLSLFSKYVQHLLLNDQNIKEGLLKEAVIKATQPYWKQFNRFAIINHQLILYFNKREITSQSEGIYTLAIPLSYINPILSNPIQTDETSNVTILTDTTQKQTKPTKRVALTFDDGPHPTVTKQILNILHQYDAKATFFIVGTRAKKYPEMVKEIKKQGHEIGNHSWNHKNLTKLTPEQVLSQINATNNVIKEATGEDPTVIRPPYGATNKQISELVSVPVVLWTIDTLDWKYRDPNKLLPMVKKSMHNNAIILMHDIHQSTADGLESVLNYLQNEGYEFVTVSEVLQYR